MDLDEKDDEEENYYLKLYEKIKMRKQKWFEKFGDLKDFELKYRVFKDELERLRKLSKEDFLRDTLLFLQEDDEIDYSKKEKRKLKIDRINEYKEFIKDSKAKRDGLNNFFKSQILFKPNCEFNTSKI